jgi:trehalose/maltose hydrolase-like predicted phosphorylase
MRFTTRPLPKQCLIYRYNRIGEARKYAASENKQGAMYPWQSGMYGDEQSQFVHLNPVSGQWDPDNSRLQRHVSISVAYDVINYVHITGDQAFMNDYGLEMLLSICKFWVSMTTYDKTRIATISIMSWDRTNFTRNIQTQMTTV